MEAVDKSGKVKLTVELEINQALMDLARDKMDKMMDVVSQWRPNMGGMGGKGKMGMGEGGGHGGMGMMHHGAEMPKE
jgi:hypothetical protein